jgi:peptidyl-prolyl cis-trans isomerase C
MILGGCGGGGGDDTVLATVGGDKIYTRDLNDIFQRTRQNYLTFEDEFDARRNILDSLVIQQILIQEAYKKNIDESEEIKRIVLANQDKFLLDVLYQKMVIEPVSVTEDDIKDYYSQLEHKVQASHILVSVEDTAYMLLDSLKKGGNFENLAVNYSIDPTAGTNRGDLGYFIWGQMDPTFQENVFKMQPGEISEPFKTRYGWHIVKMVDRSENELRSTYQKMQQQIKMALEGSLKKENLENYSNVIKEKYPIRIDSISCEYLMHKRATLYPPSLLETLPKNDFDITQLDRDEKELIMATWEAGQMTVGQYLAQRRQLGNRAPAFDDYEGLAQVIFQLNFMNILGTEARQSGLQDDDKYKRRIRKFKELAMADVMQNDSIVYPGEPDEGEIRSYYDSHLEDFQVPAKIHVYEIMFNDHGTAKSYMGKIKTLKKFKSLAAKHTERTGKRRVEGDMGYIDKRSYPRLFGLAENFSVGEVAGPIQIGSKYSIIYVAAKNPEQVKDFLQVKPRIKDILDRKLNEDAFGFWVEKKRAKVDIKIYENNIRAGIDKARYETEIEPSS